MNIAIVRGDFASPWELQNFSPLAKKHHLTLFTGLQPVADLNNLTWLEKIALPSPVDLNFGKINRYTMAVLNRMFTDAHVLFGLEEKLKGYDIAHCAETYYSYTQQCLNAKKKGFVKKIISTVWENIAFNNEKIPGRKEFKHRALNGVDYFLPVTKMARKVLVKEGCSPQKIKVLNPGVDTKFFRPGKRDQTKIKLLVVSRLVAEKGISEIVNIFSKLKRRFPNLELEIAGRGPIQPAGVTLFGQVDYANMPKIYSSSDIFVHYPIGSPSWQEQYGMVLIEAMASGLPVVCLNRGSAKEIVAKAGLVVSKSSFEDGLASLIKDQKKRERLGENARIFATKNYDIHKFSHELEKIYQTI